MPPKAAAPPLASAATAWCNGIAYCFPTVCGERDLAIAYLDPESRKPLVNIYKDVEPAVAP